MSTQEPIDPAKINLARFARTYNRLTREAERWGVNPAEPPQHAPTITPVAAFDVPDDEGRSQACRTLLQRANTAKPDATTMAEVRAFFDAAPDAWRGIGNLAQLAAQDLVQGIAPTWIRQEAITRTAQEMREAMGYQDAPVMERTLIEHIVLCWLRLQRAEINYTRITSEALSLDHAEYWERRLSAAQKRYLRALETLARVRRLVRPQAPSLQVNIAENGGQQVNQVT